MTHTPEVEHKLIRTSFGVWFELHGAILNKKREVLRYPKLLLNRMQREIDEIIMWCAIHGVPCRIVTLKGRQQGSSTVSVGTGYKRCRERPTKMCIIGDLYERSVANLEAMFNDYAKHDTYDWGNTYYQPGKRFSNGSQLVTETANSPRAGASGTFQTIIATEVAHWPEANGTTAKKVSAKAVFAALLNCVPMEPETLVVVESTPNGAAGVYYDTYQAACSFENMKAGNLPPNWNGFIQVFYPWHEHPEYQKAVTPEEAEAIMNSLSERELELVTELGLPPERLAWRRMKLADPAFNGDEDKFEEEFASDQERCFLMSGRRAFPAGPLMRLRKAAEREAAGLNKFGVLQWTPGNEIKAVMRPTSREEAWCCVWERPTPGLTYVLSVDPMTGEAHGDDPDNHAVHVWREGYWDAAGKWKPRALVARLADFGEEARDVKKRAACKWDIPLLEHRVAMLASFYGWCTVAVEINMDRGLIHLLRQRAMVHLYVRKIPLRIEQKDALEYGWKTDPKTRGVLVEMLKAAIRHWDEPGEGIMIWDLVTIREMETLVIHNGKEQAGAGCHDDQVISAGIGLVTLPAGRMMPYPRRGDDRPGPSRDMTYS